MNRPMENLHERIFRRVLVGLDGSEESERSLPWVRFLAPGAEFVLGRIVESVGAGSPYVDSFSAGSILDHGESYLAQLAGRFSPRPRTELRFGSLGDGLLGIARERGCDLVSITTRGGSRLWRRLLGGATERLLHNSEFPILAVPARGSPPPARGLTRIAVLLDGTPETEVILPTVAGLARREESLVYLVHCSDSPPRRSNLPGEHPPLEAVAQGLRSQGVRTSAIEAGDLRAEDLVREVADTGAEIIAMGVRGHGALRHLVSGGLPSRIIQHSPLPVLVLRHDATVIPGRDMSSPQSSSRDGVRP